MATGEVERLATCITCHAWNGDRTKVALCPNNNSIHIYAKSGNSFVLEHTLTEHDQVVTGLDWAPKTNRIVSSSQDRNAYVWTFGNDGWKPTLVILRINRAATYVKWSPEENKFAVASGAKCVSVCYFEEDNNWWVSKHIKKHKSTVLKLDWHPNNVLLATGSSDFKARVFGAFIKGVDGKPDPKKPNPFGDKIAFGELLLEMDCSGWVHAIKWSPSGNRLVYVGHDSSINFAEVGPPPVVQNVKLHSLPFRDVLFLTEDSLVGVGEDANPTLFQAGGGNWKFVGELDKNSAAKSTGAVSAMNTFKNKVDLGSETSNDTKVDTLHQNTITCITAFKSAGNTVSQFTTSGLDGNLITWTKK